MSKAILIMDMPETCHECFMCRFSEVEDDLICVRNKLPIETFMGIRPDTCPLIPAIGYVEPVGNMISWEDEE